MTRPHDLWQTAVDLADRHAPFLRRLLRAETDIPALLKQHGPEPLLKGLHATLAKIDPLKIKPEKLMELLRQCRSRAALGIGLADIAGVLTADEVTAALSDFAQACIHASVQTAVAQALKARKLPVKSGPRADQMAAHGLACLALGKLGGRELNYSSDVDLVFFYDETRLLPDSDATDALSRVVHEAARYLQESTADGYVFRVDLRLRPDPGATPPAISMAAAEVYYQSAALTWERAAYTRARAIAGDVAAGTAFLQRLNGWIWRRSLDFTAIQDIQALREQILEHFDLENFDPAGFDVKRGIGGIREIEFLLQIQQLIHGGRRPELRTRHTPTGLRTLAQLGFIPEHAAESLVKNYHWLRQLEHRLQMVDDEQTHILPKNQQERENIAQFLCYADAPTLEDELKTACMSVREIYLATLGESQAADKPLPVTNQIAQAQNYIDRWQTGRYRSLSHPRARTALEKIQPTLFAMMAKAPDPQATLLRWDKFLEKLPSGVALLEMFQNNPKLLDLIIRVMSLSEATGEQLARHPQLLDAVLDPNFFSPLTEPAHELEKLCAPINDLETLWVHIARWVAEKRFQLSVQLLDSITPPRTAARDLSRVLDAAVARLLHAACDELERQHGKLPENQPVILALGGWGGESLGLTSDLDMVLLFTGAHDALSRGKKQVSASTFFNKLVPRLTNMLTAANSDGRIADVDMRLRPSGAKGLLSVSVDSFAAYQKKDAWVWEHMALTRARHVVGPATEMRQVLADVFAIMRDNKKVIADILDMRQDMDTHRASHSAWDMKLAPGGLVDIEFIVHTHQLLQASFHPRIVQPVLEDALTELVAAACLTPTQGRTLQEALALQHAIRTVLGLCEAGDATEAISKPVTKLLCKVTGHKTVSALEKSIRKVRGGVMDMWHTTFGKPRITEETSDAR